MQINQLNVSDLEILFLKIYENACELIEEAEILYNHQKYARSYLCSHSAFEEFGKLPMLHTTAINIYKGEKVDWKELNKRIRNHISKISLSSLTVFYFDNLMLTNKAPSNNENLDEDGKFTETDFIEDTKEMIGGIPLNKEWFQEFLASVDIKSMKKSNGVLSLKLKEYREGSLYADFNNMDFMKPSERIDKETCEYGYTIAYLQKKFIESPNIHLKGFQFEAENIKQSDEFINKFIAKNLNQFKSKE